QTWDGAAGSASDIANPHADFAANQPIQLVVHGKGASERIWAACGTRAVYASAVDSDNFVTGVVKIPIDTQDSYGVIGLVEWKDTLWAFGKRQAFPIDDISLTTSEWGYENSPWNAGAGNHRLIVKTDNDLVVFTIDGDIYSVSAAIQTGDYKASSIARPAYIDRWIRENIDLSKIEQFHACYDPSMRCIKFFMVRNGSSQVDVCLPYFIDRPVNEAWGAPHENTASNSGYKASCSALIRKAVGNYKIYTGDYLGFMWELETANINDDSAAYRKGFTFPYIGLGNPIMTKMIDKGRIVTEPVGSWDISVDIWVDNILMSTQTVSLTGTGDVLDSFVLDTDVLGGQYLIDESFPIGTTGKRIKGELYNTGINQDFRISQVLIPYRNLGVRP
ncbi:MAG: hypothetical protein Q8P28_03275, partial [Deltaproteobacteria bacterium]|nr:hypothetical protein [Deltaproteobacteria bacterium]